MSARDIVFLDLETTGLEDERHEILELAAVRVTDDGDVVSWMSERVWPVDLSTASPKALEVNGFDEAAWTLDGVSSYFVYQAFLAVVEGCDPLLFGMHNAIFDVGFLKAEPTFRPRLRPRYAIDTSSMAEPLRKKGKITSVSLETLCKHFDVTCDVPAHSALGDTLRCIAVYRGLVDESPLTPYLPPDLRTRA